jgi:predicted metalloprotease with PDZ domain
LLFVLAGECHATIRYDVTLTRPVDHSFHVSMTIPAVQQSVDVQMAAWDTLYEIRDFAHHVTNFHASDSSGRQLAVRRKDKQTWQISGGGDLRVQYDTNWNEPGPFATEFDAEHAFMNPAMVLCYVPGRIAEDTVLQFDGVPQGWRVAVELPPMSTTDAAPTSFSAANYAALADAPVEIGRFEEVRFRAGDRPIRAVLHGDSIDKAKFIATLSAIVNYETALMGGAPFDEYTFFFHVGRRYGGGGMEHSNCTAIAVDSAAGIPGVSAHEFFHLWNVKRIRPQSLEPLDRTKEMYSPALWFAEGVTNTYGSYALVRSGLWSKPEFLSDLSGEIMRLETRPARFWQSAEESSLTTWFDKYSLYNGPEFSISYYNKGQLLGVGLDLVIRDATDNRASLDDVLRRLNQEYAQRGRFYADSDGIRMAAEDVMRQAGAGAKADLSEFFRRYVAGTDPLPYGEWLGVAGLALNTTGGRDEVVDVPQASERQRRVLASWLRGAPTGAAAAGGR